jgi:hypothetical protein
MKTARPRVLAWSAGLMLLSLAAACGGSRQVAPPAPPASPAVTSITPVYGATSVPGNGSVSATFSEAMDPSSITSATFTLTSGPLAVPVPGTVTYADSKAIFRPTARLHRDRTYSATITTGARSASGDPLAAKRSWRFDTVKAGAVCL